VIIAKLTRIKLTERRICPFYIFLGKKIILLAQELAV
jgi:hypothetical protein